MIRIIGTKLPENTEAIEADKFIEDYIYEVYEKEKTI